MSNKRKDKLNYSKLKALVLEQKASVARGSLLAGRHLERRKLERGPSVVRGAVGEAAAWPALLREATTGSGVCLERHLRGHLHGRC